jgi:hypothetical protein
MRRQWGLWEAAVKHRVGWIRSGNAQYKSQVGLGWEVGGAPEALRDAPKAAEYRLLVEQRTV